MKTIIIGPKDVNDSKIIETAIQKSGFNITEVVSCGVRGVCKLGEEWAIKHRIPVTRFVAEWYRHGRPAGKARNEKMISYSDALIAIWTGDHRVTRDVILHAQRAKLDVYIHIVRESTP